MADESIFKIEILSQAWRWEGEEAARVDIHSHGKLRVTIGGVVVANEESSVNEAALALLRTLERDHSPDAPVAEYLPGKPRLFFDGCGMFPMGCCPIGMDWKVEHLSGFVRVSNVRRWDTTKEAPTAVFPDLLVDIPERLYRRVVVDFAKAAKQFFVGVSKVLDDPYRTYYEQFWQEYDRLLEKFSGTCDAS